jgi:tetratricopeptide (TPR) repeat protein
MPKALFITALSALFLLHCSRAKTQPARSAAKPVVQPVQRFVDRSLPARTIDTAPVAEQAAVVEAMLRPRPDRRVLIAIGDVHELLTGKRADPEIFWTNDAWTIRANGKDVGTLPELATFAEGTDLLTRLATSLGAKPAAQQVDPSAFYADALFGAAKNADPAAAAEAAALINYQTVDRFGLADPLRARGLALLAIARASGADTTDLATMMATSLGYDREGGTPKQLSPAAQQWIELRNRMHATRYERRLALLTDASARALPLFLGRLEMHENVGAANATARLIASDVSGDAKPAQMSAYTLVAEDRVAPKKSLSIFENALPQRTQSLASRAFPAEVIRSYYEAMFYSAHHAAFHTLVDSYGSRERAEQYVSELADAQTPVGSQVHDFLRFAIAAKYERGGNTPAQQALFQVPLLGGASRAWLLSEYVDSVGTDQHVRRTALHIFPTLDTRPGELYEAGMLAHRALFDPVRREKLIGAALQRSPLVASGGTIAWYYALKGNAASLHALASSKSASAFQRATALSEPAKLPGADPRAIAASFEALLNEAGYGSVYPLFAGFANEQRDWKTKERIARQWLAKHEQGANSTANPIEVAYYAASLGDALEQQGRYEEAWKVIEPHVPVYSANIISTALSVLERRGEVDAAEKLGEQYIERYPGANSRADLAMVYWRRKRFDDAADLFDRSHRLDSYGLRRDVPEAFVATFRTMPGDAVAALDALTRKGAEPWLAYDVIRTAREKKEYELAARLAEKQSDIWNVIEGWRAMRAWKGPDAANAWLQPRVPDSQGMGFVAAAYQAELPELVLAYATPRQDSIKSIEMLTFIAAALSELRVPADDPRRVMLVEQVRAHGEQPKTLLPIAQYLLGTMDEAAFLRWPYEPAGRATAAYFVGLKADVEGNRAKALSWMLAANQGPDKNPPVVWAGAKLARWSEERKASMAGKA